MKPRLQALRALRLNFSWRVTLKILRERNCFGCWGLGFQPENARGVCATCGGVPKPGWRQVLSEPDRVTQEQHAIAEGAFV